METTAILPVIEKGQTLKARSACDSECIFEAVVIERNGNFATVKTMNGTDRKKIMRDERGEFMFALGRYSMAPVFRPSAS